MPLIERSLTISGGAVNNPCNIRVPVGTIVSDLIPDVFTLKDDEVVKVISGGPMMGFSMTTANFPIAKGTSGVTFLTAKETFLDKESQCIGCGKCVSTCAMHLSPVLIKRALEAENFDKARSFGLMDCIECGCCAFVCPADINLVQRFRLGKAVVPVIESGFLPCGFFDAVQRVEQGPVQGIAGLLERVADEFVCR